MAIEVKVRRIGTSLGIIVPKEKLKALDVGDGDTIIIRRIEKPVEEIRGILKGTRYTFARKFEDRGNNVDSAYKSIRKSRR